MLPPCRSELARDGLKGGAFIQKTRVIVNVHREQARSYRGRYEPIHAAPTRLLQMTGTKILGR